MDKIVIIEDERNARVLIRHMLEEDGYAVFEAGDAKAGCEMIEQVNPDLVITDIFMPGMNGLELIQELTKEKPELPIIAMTGLPDILQSTKELGAVDVLRKPIEQEELLAAVRKSLRTSKVD